MEEIQKPFEEVESRWRTRFMCRGLKQAQFTDTHYNSTGKSDCRSAALSGAQLVAGMQYLIRSCGIPNVCSSPQDLDTILDVNDEGGQFLSRGLPGVLP